ncbi:MAG TPA: helix-turn-helix domain-containing protein, partial [Pseudonocardia sp.]|nr:helix-turn-helix domain-containing protein [Pseudonocardia sp.]
MPVQQRRERQRAERHRLILDTARRIAESEGWDAVTTRRLADAIEYSQPVLYSHFAGKDEIVAAVALDGFA